MTDMFEKRRRKYVVRAGELCATSKLSDDQCENIRMLFALGARQRDVATWFGIGQSQAHRIKVGQSRHRGSVFLKEG
jgi:hypothetical protein